MRSYRVFVPKENFFKKGAGTRWVNQLTANREYFIYTDLNIPIESDHEVFAFIVSDKGEIGRWEKRIDENVDWYEIRHKTY